MIFAGRVVLAAALIAAMASNPAGSLEPKSGSPAAAPASEPLLVRVGYTTFDPPEKVRSDSTLQSVQWYLGEIETRSKSWKHPLKFELALGNYYQVRSWFKTAQIDAAIVSPFQAMLLEREGQGFPIVEFAESTGSEAAAHYPVVVATNPWSGAPLAGLDGYLEELLGAVRQGELDSQAVRGEVAKIREKFRLDLVAHLSASGFIMPALYVQAWLDSPERGKLDETLRSRFWRLFFENAHLTLAHGNTHAEAPASTIKFSYQREGVQRDKAFGEPVRYKAGPLPDTAPSIPNDVLLVRGEIAGKLEQEGVDRSRIGELFITQEIQQRFRNLNSSYKEVRPFNAPVHGRFREAVNGLFSHEVKDAELARLNVRWFERGKFDFTIDETMAFLRQDQVNSGIQRLGVVLSGGGVKSLYQTVLLDRLYQSGTARQLRNAGQEAESAADGSLTVHTVIGTSGGAMLAFFAAQLPQIGTLLPIVKATSSKPLFPRIDLLRLLSIFLLLIVLLAVLLLFKTFNGWGYGVAASRPVHTYGSRSVIVVALLLVLFGAVAIVTTRSEYLETVPTAEAVFYILTCWAAHFGMMCVTRADGAPSLRQAALGRFASLGLVLGIQLVLLSVAVRHWLRPEPRVLHRVELPGLSLLASAGVFMIAAALVTAAAAGRWGLTVRGVRAYVAALTAAAVVTVATFLPLIALEIRGWGTVLELTGLYWGSLFVAALAASVGLLFFARRPRKYPLGILHDGFVELMRDRRRVLTTSMVSTIVAMFGFCIVCWVLLVVPAVYGNVAAVRAFSEALTEDQLWTGGFQANLVVTGTLLRAAQCSPGHTINEGGLYFCFDGPGEGCRRQSGGQWQVFRRPSPAHALDAVFASGSAFPVFPPHLAHLPDGCEVRLVDGGYAHNIPLEAAYMSEVRQVLILNASPDPLDLEEQPQSSWRRVLRQAQLEGGQLFRSSPDVLAFLFARAQELDRNIGGGLVVASLTPQPESGWWPFLLDFRPSVQEELLRVAHQDICQERRIGHVLSWGRPVLLPSLQRGQE